MALIKSQHADDLAHDAIVLDLGDLRRQARVLMDRAKLEAERIVAEAKQEAEQLTAGAEHKGYEAGHARGLEEGRTAGHAAGRAEAIAEYRQQLDQLQEAWVHAARQWDADRRTMLLEARQSLLALAIQLAEKIVRRVPKIDPSIVVDQVAEAIEYVARPCDVTVRVNAQDRPLLDDAMTQLIDELGQVEHAHLVNDERITPGGCVVTYGAGHIDATLETQLQRVVDALLPDEGSGFRVQGSDQEPEPNADPDTPNESSDETPDP